MHFDVNILDLRKSMVGLLSIALLGAVPSAVSAAEEDETAQPQTAPPQIEWTPASSTVVNPSPVQDLETWQSNRGRYTVPSVDQELTDPILTGAVDLHAHFGPDAYDRQADAFEIARLVSQRGMRGLVFKTHGTQTATVAGLVRQYAGVPDLEVFGAVSLNTAVGGVNPQAVRYFAEVEGEYARVVWMPTHDSEHEVRYLEQNRPFVSVSRNGFLLPEVLDVLDVIKHYNLTLATGHVTPEEMLQIMGEAKARGITRIIVTHPRMGPMYTYPSMEQLQQAVELGGSIEVVSNNLLGEQQDEFVEMIRLLGPENCFVTSDSGLTGLNNHSDALVLSIRVLRGAGFSEADLDLMFRKNPAALVGLAELTE